MNIDRFALHVRTEKGPTCRLKVACRLYGPGDPNEGDLLAVAVVDQGHADVLQREDHFLLGQLSLLALTQHLVDGSLLREQHHALETCGSTTQAHTNAPGVSQCLSISQ